MHIWVAQMYEQTLRRSEMKVDSTDSARHLLPSSIKTTRKQDGDFKSVFDQTVERSGESVGCLTPSGTAAMETVSGSWAVRPDLLPAPETAADELLDSLERYQCELKDPESNLRQIQPIVARMQEQAAGISPLLDQLSQTHPLRSILQDALTLVSGEVAKFNSGHYVDQD